MRDSGADPAACKYISKLGPQQMQHNDFLMSLPNNEEILHKLPNYQNVHPTPPYLDAFFMDAFSVQTLAINKQALPFYPFLTPIHQQIKQ
jgi:hypothetical protein